MNKKHKQLTQAEIWDDTALLQSWEDALEEYKFYHSIHAKGERVEDILRAADNEEEMEDSMATGGIATAQKQHPAERMREELEDGELEEGMNGQEPPMEVSDDKKEPAPPLNHAPPSATSYSVQSPASIPVPTATVNDANDDVLKNLMMSWYWAGYYTGLYEGQQRATMATQ